MRKFVHCIKFTHLLFFLKEPIVKGVFEEETNEENKQIVKRWKIK